MNQTNQLQTPQTIETDNYIYEVKGMVLPFNRYDSDNTDNMFYYYKKQTPKQTITVRHYPKSPTMVDIYTDPKYHDAETDEEVDMDIPENAGWGNDGDGEEEEDDEEDEEPTDLLKKLTNYLTSLPSSVPNYLSPVNLLVPTIATEDENPVKMPRRLTKKNRQRWGGRRHTKHAHRVHPKYSY